MNGSVNHDGTPGGPPGPTLARMVDEHRPAPGRRLSPKAIVVAILVVLLLIFVLQNTDDTPIHFLFWNVTTGTWLALVVTFVLGLLLGLLLPRLRDRE
jgi:uncharacterized integral membrane protein